jgi:gentisate 1,2-dioxygenase
MTNGILALKRRVFGQVNREDLQLELSDIQSSPEELQEYYAQLGAQHVTPAWIGGGISIEPHSEAVPYLWHWRDLRPQAMRAAELVGTAQAERRVLRLSNPNLSGVASNTLVANIQIVMPGEIAGPIAIPRRRFA